MTSPRVTIAIPAYKATYLHAALRSALAQDFDHDDFEVLVCDDCPDDAVRNAVRDYLDQPGGPVVRYLRNPTPLRSVGNFGRCVREARGHYIKFLCDDDLLEPGCLRALVAVLDAHAGVSLVSSRRQRIDTLGNALPDDVSTCFLFEGDTVVHGRDLVSYLVDCTINFVGEPTTVMFRRAQMLPHADAIFSLGGQRVEWLGDLTMHVNLLREGHLAMLDQVWSQFRISPEQESQQARDVPHIGETGYSNFRRAIQKLGLHRKADNGMVRTAPLAQPDAFGNIDLKARMQRMMRGEAPINPLLRWVEARVPHKGEGEPIDARLAAHGGGPCIGVFVRDPHGNAEKLMSTLRSLEYGRGLYGNLRIVVLSAAAASGTAPTDRVHLMHAPAETWVDTLNLALVQSTCDWCVVADVGDEFTRSGLLMAALRLIAVPDTRVLWCDELRRLPDGGLGAAFRPDFNLDLLLSLPGSMARHALFHRAGVLQAGGFDPAFAEAAEFELTLRLIDAGGIAGLGHLAEALLTTDAPVLREVAHERLALEQHLARRGYDQAVIESALPGRYRVRYGHADQPLVSIIVPTKNQLPMLQRCVESLLEKTAYPNYEVLIVDNGSTDADAVHWLDGIAAMDSPQVRVLRWPHPFNYSAINNMAAREARGDYLVLLNNDTAVVRADWLDALLNHALRPEVGIVGAKLLFPDGTIQHAGVVLGLRGPADHPFMTQPMDAAGYMHRLEVDQNYSVVTAACLMVRRSVYEAVGGLDEAAFRVSFNDVDFCLRVGQAGYLVVWTPHAVVLHEGGVSQSKVDTLADNDKVLRFRGEETAMYERWLPLLARDPAYNKNLSLQGMGFTVEPDRTFTWRPVDWKPVPQVVVLPADRQGCGHYRMMKPFEGMKAQGLVAGMVYASFMDPVQIERYDASAIVFQRQLTDEQLDGMRTVRKYARGITIYELDDYLPNLPVKSVHKREIGQDVIKALRRGVSLVDRFVVSTEPLAEQFAGWHPDIRVVPNRLPPVWWRGLAPSMRRAGRLPRVGWAGGSGHTGDLELIAEVVKALAGEVEWVFFGMCPDRLRPHVSEIRPGVPINNYPRALAGLNLDLALAPLEQNLFNECKSNLRLLEYGACGYPVVCSDVVSYRTDLPVTRVKNRFKDWVDAIRMHTTDLDAAARAGDALRDAVLRDWMLEGQHLLDWRDAWTGR